MSLMQEYWASVKSPDTEEKLDLYFYRPIGFLIAKISALINLTPTQLSLLGLVSGVLGGYFYYYTSHTEFLVMGTFLFILSGLFDSADGQLARLTNHFSKIGLVIDGICDNFVFISVYYFSTLALVPSYGPEIFILALVAGVSHSAQSAILDYYNREYLYFGYGKTEDDHYWNSTAQELKQEAEKASKLSERILGRIRISWVAQQNFLSTRSSEERLRMRSLVRSSNPEIREKFMSKYRELNKTMIRFWRLMGSNFHTIMIIFFVFIRRFDLYLILIDIVFLNLAIYFLRKVQRKCDDKLLADF